MSARRDRMVRVAKVAAETEEQARARWAQATGHVTHVDQQRETALDRAAQLATQDLPLAFRGHLTGVGARYLQSLADRKSELMVEADARRAELQEAVTKVKSLDRLIDRLDRDAQEAQDRRTAAELQDLVAIRAARDRVGANRQYEQRNREVRS